MIHVSEFYISLEQDGSSLPSRLAAAVTPSIRNVLSSNLGVGTDNTVFLRCVSQFQRAYAASISRLWLHECLPNPIELIITYHPKIPIVIAL
jgi:hypothetical protein